MDARGTGAGRRISRASGRRRRARAAAPSPSAIRRVDRAGAVVVVVVVGLAVGVEFDRLQTDVPPPLAAGRRAHGAPAVPTPACRGWHPQTLRAVGRARRAASALAAIGGGASSEISKAAATSSSATAESVGDRFASMYCTVAPRGLRSASGSAAAPSTRSTKAGAAPSPSSSGRRFALPHLGAWTREPPVVIGPASTASAAVSASADPPSSSASARPNPACLVAAATADSLSICCTSAAGILTCWRAFHTSARSSICRDHRLRSLTDTALTVRWIGGHAIMKAHGSPSSGSSRVMSPIGRMADGFDERPLTPLE